jgi:hypothetical protein
MPGLEWFQRLAAQGQRARFTGGLKRGAFALLVYCLHAVRAAEPAPGNTNDWVHLFNGKDFSGWDVFIATPDSSQPLTPNHDPQHVFEVTNTAGENLIHVSGQIYGAISTGQEFENFHFRVDFKWGLTRWPPRANVGRDTGILYCSVGDPNPRTGWMTSIENNIMEKGVGQWWSVNGALIDTEGEWITGETEMYIPYKKEGAGEKNIVWKRGASRITPGPSNGITPPFDLEQVFGNWNTVEVIFWGGTCIHLLNGQVNLVAFNPRYQKGDRWLPLDHGKIQLQSEGAEVFFREPTVRSLTEMPERFREYIVSPVVNDEGFVPLFSENALKQWKQCGPGKFLVQDGVATGQGGMGLWWYTGREFTNFVLRGEFVQEQDIADSGVFVRFPDPGNDPWVAVHKGHEMEIGDPHPEKPTWRTGSIYPFQASTTANTKPLGQWNDYEIVCRGHDYSVRINGKLVNTWSDTTRRSLHGFIGLQNYNDQKTVRHRNVRVKELL